MGVLNQEKNTLVKLVGIRWDCPLLKWSHLPFDISFLLQEMLKLKVAYPTAYTDKLKKKGLRYQESFSDIEVKFYWNPYRDYFSPFRNAWPTFLTLPFQILPPLVSDILTLRSMFPIYFVVLIFQHSRLK